MDAGGSYEQMRKVNDTVTALGPIRAAGNRSSWLQWSPDTNGNADTNPATNAKRINQLRR